MRIGQRLALGYFRATFRMLSAVSPKKSAVRAFHLFQTPLSRHKKPLPPIFLEAESLSMKMGNLTVQGWRWNHPSPRKVLIAHGFESSATNFDRYIRPLIKKGYEVLAFDAPGHGRSGGTSITAPIYKDMILQVYSTYGPLTGYLGHSFGGLALCLALEEIPHTREDKLVLIAPATETPTAINSFFTLLQLGPPVRSAFEQIIIEKGGQPSAWYSITRAVESIDATIRWFHDEDDDVTPLADTIPVREKNYPNLEFVVTSGLGHRRIYKDNKVTRQVIDFF